MGAAPSCGRPPTPVDKKMAKLRSRAARRLQFEKVEKHYPKSRRKQIRAAPRSVRRRHALAAVSPRLCAPNLAASSPCLRPTNRVAYSPCLSAPNPKPRWASRSWGRFEAHRDGALRLHGAPRFSPPPKKKSEKGRQNERWPSAHLKGLRPNQPPRLPHPQKTNELSKKKGRESTREVLMPSPVGFFCAGVKKQGKVCDKG